MRFIALFILFFVPSAFSSCPQNIDLGSLKTSSNTPPFTLCVANSDSSTGYCTATCGVSNSCLGYGTDADSYRGSPFITTGQECSGSDSGSGSGSPDSSSLANGTWGSGPTYSLSSDSTNTNLVKAAVQSHYDSGRVFEQVYSIRNFLTTGINASLSDIASKLGSLTSDISNTKTATQAVNENLISLGSSVKGAINDQASADSSFYSAAITALHNIESNTAKIASSSGSSGGSSGGDTGGDTGGDSGSSSDLPTMDYWNALLNNSSSTYGTLSGLNGMLTSAMGYWGSTQGYTSSINSQLGSVQGYLGTIQGNTSSLSSNLGQMNGSLSAINGKLDGILSAMQNGAGDGTGDGTGDGSGSDGIGSADNPAHVASSAYKTACNGAECFFSTSQANQELNDIKEQYQQAVRDIQSDFKDMFDVSFDGSAEYPKCFDLYNIFGKEKEVCIDSQEYFNILQSLMMFIYAMIAFYAFMRFN